jgi:hypothetical protein
MMIFSCYGTRTVLGTHIVLTTQTPIRPMPLPSNLVSKQFRLSRSPLPSLASLLALRSSLYGLHALLHNFFSALHQARNKRALESTPLTSRSRAGNKETTDFMKFLGALVFPFQGSHRFTVVFFSLVSCNTLRRNPPLELFVRASSKT